MNTWIMLLRGINVGGKSVLPMQELVSIVESCGYTDIETYIQSGNVVLRSDKPVGKKAAMLVSKAILDRKGFEPKLMFLDVESLKEAIANNPFPTDVGKALHFFFLDQQPGSRDLTC